MDVTLNANHLKNILEPTKDLITDITLQITDKGIYSQTMDMSRVSICELKIVPDDCESFKHDEDCEMSFNLSNFIKCLKCFESKESVTLTYNLENSDRLQINGIHSSYEIPLMNIEPEYMDLSIVNYNNSIVLDAKRWCEILEKHAFLESDCQLGILKGAINFKFESTIGKASIVEQVNKDENEMDNLCNQLESINIKQSSLGEFSMRYLLACTKINKLADSVTLEYNEHFPLRITTALSAESFMRCYIAPKET